MRDPSESHGSRPLGIERYEPTLAEGRAQASGAALTQAVERTAMELGFARVGFAPATPLTAGRDALEAFRAHGYAGTMRYLMQEPRDDPRRLLPEARTVVVVALVYGEPNLLPLRTRDGSLVGSVARYARGNDYHAVLKRKLSQLAERIACLSGRPLWARACVDTAPLLERELARVAGVGFHGKSTLLITPGLGSYVLLGELLIDLDLEIPENNRSTQTACGSCRACLDACPTGAFVSAHVLDARRCIAYLTIEYSGVIDRELRSAIGTRVFGCDVCQEVCPFNASPKPRRPAPELGRSPELAQLDLIELLSLGASAYRRLVRGTALRRTSRATLQRNAAIALGNSGDARAVPPLVRALRENPHPVVRVHAAWALGRLSQHLDSQARASLESAALQDADPGTREEARHSIAEHL